MPSMPRMSAMSGVMRGPRVQRRRGIGLQQVLRSCGCKAANTTAARPDHASECRENHCDCVVSSLKRLVRMRWRTMRGDPNKRAKREAFVNKFLRAAGGVTIASLLALPAGAAEIRVGLITSMTGPGSSIGIPYSKGTAAAEIYKDNVNGIKIKVEQLDDASDPSTGTRDARKLIEQDNVDLLMGAGNTPITPAIAALARDQKV